MVESIKEIVQNPKLGIREVEWWGCDKEEEDVLLKAWVWTIPQVIF